MVVQSLVDYLATQLGCEFISDLRFLTSLERLTLARVIKKLQPADFPLHEWNDAIQYIVNKRVVNSSESAYRTLLTELQIGISD